MKSAVVFAALALWLAGWLPAAGAGGAGKPRQQEKSFEATVGGDKVKVNYLLFLPKGYEKSDKAWPLLVFLHGAGERGDDLDLVKKNGPPRIVEKKGDFPFIVVSPQAPSGKGRGFGWNVEALAGLVDHVKDEYKVDPDRVYLTGLSMGGFGSWALAAKYPEKFAAVVPICGGGDPSKAEALAKVPIWAFHGGKDTTVRPELSERMVEAIKKAGGDAKLTIYPNAGHDSWTETYNNPKLYEWLLEHKRDSKQFEGTWKSGDGSHTGELFCTAVRLDGGTWTATFSGYCNRQFVYRVRMDGKENGQAVRFAGSADLGDQDGVYQWTGSLSGDTFTGEYMSAKGGKGSFEMGKVQSGE